jgi:6-pyruvoyltetrahydropterin/6-carboxytetrahydropterin synthase
MPASAVRTAGTIFLGGLDFDYAHFIPSHPKCGRLHGHTSSVQIEIAGERDEFGMVLDFAVLKSHAKAVLDPEQGFCTPGISPVG